MLNGETLKHIIRCNHISISELSRKLKVSRGSIYNWFRKESLSQEIIHKIGEVLNYDFSAEFSEPLERENLFSDLCNPNRCVNVKVESVIYWRDKYITFLNKQNDI